MAKTCICVKCGKEVLKNTTYFVGNGRACKTHDGVQEFAEQQKEKEIKRLANINPQKERAHKQEQQVIPQGPSCFICGKVGIRADEQSKSILILMNMIKLGEEGQPVDKTGISKALHEIAGKTPIHCLDSKKYPQMRQHLRHEMRVGFDAFGFFGICQECCHKHGIDTNPLLTNLLKQEDGLAKMAALGSVMSDTIKERIKGEIMESN